VILFVKLLRQLSNFLNILFKKLGRIYFC